MACDYDYGSRLKLLAELMERFPDSVMKDLQRETLKYYPLSSKEAIRNWMGSPTAFKAADILNVRIEHEQAD